MPGESCWCVPDHVGPVQVTRATSTSRSPWPQKVAPDHVEVSRVTCGSWLGCLVGCALWDPREPGQQQAPAKIKPVKLLSREEGCPRVDDCKDILLFRDSLGRPPISE